MSHLGLNLPPRSGITGTPTGAGGASAAPSGNAGDVASAGTGNPAGNVGSINPGPTLSGAPVGGAPTGGSANSVRGAPAGIGLAQTGRGAAPPLQVVPRVLSLPALTAVHPEILRRRSPIQRSGLPIPTPK
ncbi:hypothetical protein B0H17DRAFT_292797 [Mycena rosella]|uniref:Uncharacterized protein n=1 Tax=Mycena rosella TaxID=1033263 RepID=A0AAD7G3Z1_MYCRO|nr:hypothetical protein B0H17DRAFT_292797 [Mycena rosella]